MLRLEEVIHLQHAWKVYTVVATRARRSSEVNRGQYLLVAELGRSRGMGGKTPDDTTRYCVFDTEWVSGSMEACSIPASAAACRVSPPTCF